MYNSQNPSTMELFTSLNSLHIHTWSKRYTGRKFRKMVTSQQVQVQGGKIPKGEVWGIISKNSGSIFLVHGMMNKLGFQ